MPERKYKPIEPFYFNDDIWDLQQFYDTSPNKSINFETVQPSWYQLKVKKYLLYLLQKRVYKSTSNIVIQLSNLRHFGRIIQQCHLSELADINRQTILEYFSNSHFKIS